MTYLFLFILGSVLASFCNLVINRTISQESIVRPASHCETCNHRLYPYDLIPILSFILLKGRCRYCKAKLPVELFFTEIIGGLLAILAYNPNNIIQSILLALGIFLAMIIAVIDFKSFDIYMIHISILAIIASIYRYLYIGYDLIFLRKIIVFIVIYALIYKLSKGGLGNGDIYYYLSLFLFISNQYIIWFILYSLWIGAFFGLIIGIKNKSTKIEIPFCIYIFASFLIVIMTNGVNLWKDVASP